MINSLDAAINHYLQAKRLRWTPKTAEVNRAILKLFTLYYEDQTGGAPPPWPVSFEVILDWLAAVKTSPAIRRGTPATQATVHNYWRHIRAFFNFLEADGHLTAAQNPITAIIHQDLVPPTPVTHPVAFPEEDLTKVLSYLKERIQGEDLSGKRLVRDYALILFGYVTGCRVSEIVHLRLVDIDLAACRAFIRRENSKSRHDRYVGFDEGVTDALRQWFEYRSLEMDVTSPFVFTSYGGRVGHGQPLLPSALNQMMHRHLKAVGIPIRKFHGLRHSSALAAIRSGVPLTDVRDNLGHRSIETTEIYLKTTGDKHTETIKAANLSSRLVK